MKLIPTLLLLTLSLFANIPSNTYDPARNLKSKTVEGITTEYSYDADGKLIQKGALAHKGYKGLSGVLWLFRCLG